MEKILDQLDKQWPPPYKFAPWRWATDKFEQETGIYHYRRDIKQRLLYGISESDAWSLDAYFNDLIPRGIKYIRNSKCGVPGIIYNEHGEAIYDCVLHNNVSIDEGLKIWTEILDDIIAGFEANQVSQEFDELYKVDRDRRDRIIDNRTYVFRKGMALLANNWNHLWW